MQYMYTFPIAYIHCIQIVQLYNICTVLDIVGLRLVIVNLPITQKIRGNISRCIHIEINVAFLLYESTVTIQCPAQFEVEFFV